MSYSRSRGGPVSAAAICFPACLAFATTDAFAHDGPLPDGHAPAGVMFDHMHKAGEWMVGYRYMWSRMDGDTLNGTSKATDPEIMMMGCKPNMCMMKQTEMTMQMHMLDIMYAPTDWLTLMVMPQWMTMDMTMSPLDASMGGMGGMPMSTRSHGTDDFGDTIFGALIKLSDGPGYHLHTGLMFSAPTGSTDEKMDMHGSMPMTGPPKLTHYMMQLGSGTWDFLPSLTYTGRADRWSWGAQMSGIIRMEDENDQGYKLGDVFQATAWGSYRLADWLSTSIRVLHTQQGEVEGFAPTGMGRSPPDWPSNYGGRFWDVGFGLNGVVPSGPLMGHRLSVEWLEPIRDDVNGYQQERDGTLWVNWSKAF